MYFPECEELHQGIVFYTSVVCLQVYGETSFELVDQMIKSIDFNEETTFIDLGSGA